MTAPGGLAALALHHLGMRDGVHYAPDVPPAKEAAARAVHAPHLSESETILVLYDDTAFGSAKNGFLITAERICWKNLFFQPHQVPWSEVDPALVTVDGRAVGVARGSMNVSPELAEDVARLVVAMAERARPREASPYRDADGPPARLARLVTLARRHLGEVDDVFYHPAIPPAKLEHARAVHAAHLPEGEDVAVLFDATIFGSASDGFVITPARLCWKSVTGEPRAIAWPAIEPEGVTASGNQVSVMGGELFLSGRAELGAPVAGLLTAVAAKARSDGGI